MPRGRLRNTWNIEQSKLGNARINGGYTRNFRDSIDERLRRTSQRSENIGKLVPFVIGGPRFFQRSQRTDGGHERGYTTGDHKGYCQRLRPEPPEVAEELAVEHAHRITS